ncbi:MAG: ATP-binding protein [Bifidobacteriaceae bacterium]|jgi:predicted AAA+ superfamily ATPase|nr:ATP-binding protein [Bifidobacteriaceae bacterium]
MERSAMASLVKWKDSARRKPLLLQGARQVGKTWLLKEFGRREYRNVAYANFEENPSLAAVFGGDLDPSDLLIGLRAATETSIKPGATLIILDEIQACPRALTSLKYFNEEASEYHIACAGSLLGVAMHQGQSFPVGQVSFLSINPLTFTEFLQARGRPQLAEVLQSSAWDLVTALHQPLLNALAEYTVVGGMPEVVAEFVDSLDFAQARATQMEILAAFDNDFSKHVPAEQLPKVRAVWASVPQQLAKEQKRFRYRELAPGARARSHEAAIRWLSDAGLVHRVPQVSVPRLPLLGYEAAAAFKLFLLDVGLLGAMSQLPPQVAIQGDALYSEFKGSLTEQYVASHLVAALGRAPHYWANEAGRAEVDFLVQLGGDLVPIEVKAGLSTQAKSLRVYRDKYSPALAVRASLLPYRRESGLVNLPLYAIERLEAIAADAVSS